MTTQDPIELLRQMDIPFVPQNLIYHAGKGNNITAVELILKAGMNVNTQFGGQTALNAACSNGNEEIVKILISNGANVNVTNTFESKFRDAGYTPLMSAIDSKREKRNYPVSIIKILLENKADFTIKVNGIDAMALAAKFKDSEIIELLKTYGAKETTKEELDKVKKDEKRKRKSGIINLSIVAVLCIVLIGGCCWMFSGSSSSSGSSYHSSSSNSGSSEQSGTHTCVWCGKSYTGNGYMHIGSDCEEAFKWMGKARPMLLGKMLQ